eukprot:6304611-Prymnesium_polylepis.2
MAEPRQDRSRQPEAPGLGTEVIDVCGASRRPSAHHTTIAHSAYRRGFYYRTWCVRRGPSADALGNCSRVRSSWNALSRSAAASEDNGRFVDRCTTWLLCASVQRDGPTGLSPSAH